MKGAGIAEPLEAVGAAGHIEAVERLEVHIHQ